MNEIIISLLPLLGIIEVIVIVIAGVRHIIRVIKLEKSGFLLNQIQTERIGRILTFLGSFGTIYLQRLLVAKHDYSDNATIITFLVGTVGLFVFYIGIKFRESAYKKSEENRKWIKWIMNLWNKGPFQ